MICLAKSQANGGALRMLASSVGLGWGWNSLIENFHSDTALTISRDSLGWWTTVVVSALGRPRQEVQEVRPT